MQVKINGFNQSSINPMINLPPLSGRNENKINDLIISDDDIISEDTQANNKRNRKEIYGKGNEAKLIKEKLGNFDFHHSQSYQKFIQNFGRSVRLTEILAIVSAIDSILQIKRNYVLPKITRNEKRSIPLLFKYIENNKDAILPYLDRISLCDSSFHKIALDNE